MPPLPAIPGIELSGTVVERGRGITKPEVGSPVFVSARDLPVRAGCYAEYIAVPAAAPHLLPPGCELEAAAAYRAIRSPITCSTRRHAEPRQNASLSILQRVGSAARRCSLR